MSRLLFLAPGGAPGRAIRTTRVQVSGLWVGGFSGEGVQGFGFTAGVFYIRFSDQWMGCVGVDPDGNLGKNRRGLGV